MGVTGDCEAGREEILWVPVKKFLRYSEFDEDCWRVEAVECMISSGIHFRKTL